jgi:hypothetical protein
LRLPACASEACMADRDRPTSAGLQADEGFLRRWSRRKTAARSAPVAASTLPTENPSPPEAAPAPSQEAQRQYPQQVDSKDLPDIEGLDASSDFTAFMRPGVPAHLRAQALRKLWRSDPIFSKLDGLVEYGEDYTIASWPKGAIKTAYQIGRGFVNELEKLEDDKAERGATEPSVTGPEAATSIAQEAPADAPEGQAQIMPEPAGRGEPQPAPAQAPTSAGAGAPTRRRPLPRRG